MFLEFERRGFACRAGGDESVHAGFNLPLDERAERMDRDKTLLTLDLEEAGVPVEQRVGKKVAGRSVTKAGVRREAFAEWRQSLTTS